MFTSPNVTLRVCHPRLPQLCVGVPTLWSTLVLANQTSENAVNRILSLLNNETRALGHLIEQYIPGRVATELRNVVLYKQPVKMR
jgi:hypothetical protein